VIKTNLFVKPNGKSSTGAFLAGFDISAINLPMVILSVLVFYSDGIFKSYYSQPKLDVINEEITALRVQRRKIQSQLKKKDEYKKKIEDIKKREQEFVDKIQVFKNIIASARNPMSILIFLGKSITPNIWIEEMKMEESQVSFTLKGTSTSEMNSLQRSLNNSTYFQGSLQFLTRTSVFDNKAGTEVYTYALSGEVRDWGGSE